jgi:hypothetical protein
LLSRFFHASQPLFSRAAIESLLGAAAVVVAAALALAIVEAFVFVAGLLFAEVFSAAEPHAVEMTATADNSNSDLK